MSVSSVLTVSPLDVLQDLTSVLNLQKKHALLENDVNSHSDRVEVARKQSETFAEANHLDARPTCRSRRRRWSAEVSRQR